MQNEIPSLDRIRELVKPIAEKYRVERVYLFGSYARGEATADSDLDFLVYSGDNFKLTLILDLSEELREVFRKDVDAFEIREVDPDSDFYRAVLRDRVRVA